MAQQKSDEIKTKQTKILYRLIDDYTGGTRRVVLHREETKNKARKKAKRINKHATYRIVVEIENNCQFFFVS